jgi:two-component system chemotaxis response regulator CheY
MRHRASHDALTGVYNRAAILDRLHRECLRSQQDRDALGVIMVDVDHLKRINDSYGHPAGDAVLRETARRMRAVVRAHDALGRCGGEQFLIVIPRCRAEPLLALAERLREVVAAEPISIGAATVSVTLSMGVSISDKGRDAGPHNLLHAADSALCQAKHAGRNRVVFSAQTAPELIVATA